MKRFDKDILKLFKSGKVKKAFRKLDKAGRILECLRPENEFRR